MRKMTMLTIVQQVGLCPPSKWETAFIWVELRDGRPVYSDAQKQLTMHRPDWQIVRDAEHILWADEGREEIQ